MRSKQCPEIAGSAPPRMARRCTAICSIQISVMVRMAPIVTTHQRTPRNTPRNIGEPARLNSIKLLNCAPRHEYNPRLCGTAATPAVRRQRSRHASDRPIGTMPCRCCANFPRCQSGSIFLQLVLATGGDWLRIAAGVAMERGEAPGFLRNNNRDRGETLAGRNSQQADRKSMEQQETGAARNSTV